MDALKSRTRLTYRILSCFIAVTFISNVVLPHGYAQVGTGRDLSLQKESEKLVKYFLASMTIPKDDLWVNLSPYESDRIIPEELGKTELGRDMLAQDYILKQLAASLMYPEKELGKEFWSKVYQKAKEKYGRTEIPVDTFNKVWILPETATVYEHGQTVYIVEAKLRVMLDEDYVAMSYQSSDVPSPALGTPYGRSHQKKVDDPDVPITGSRDSDRAQASVGAEDRRLTTQIVKEIILPEIEKEVNEGQNFAPLRQIYHSLILAKWYKETIKSSLLSKIYIDQKKIAGVNLDDATLKDQIYAQYMEAYKKGVFNYIKEDYDRLSRETIPRKYFSGGINRLTDFSMIKLSKIDDPAQVASARVGNNFALTTRANPQKEGSSSPILGSHKGMLPGLMEARIVSLISDLNSRGVRPTVHGRDLRDFNNSKFLIKHIQQYTVLKEPEDIRRVLEWKLNITASGQFGTEAEPPLGGMTEEAADILYNVIFDQDKFLTKAKKPLNIVLFRRETGGQQLTNLLKTLQNVRVKVIVSGIDDGESWRDAAREFNATGIPTAGKTLLDLAQDDSVRAFLDSRIDNEDDLLALIMGLLHPGPFVKLESDNMKAIYQRGQSIVDPINWVDNRKTRLRRLAEYLHKFYELWDTENTRFPLKNMPLRSMILVGAAYSFANTENNNAPQWQRAIDEIGKLLNLREGDQVILPTQQRQYVIAIRNDGTVHFSEESLTNYPSRSPIVGMWLINEVVDETFINELGKNREFQLKNMPSSQKKAKNISNTTKKVTGERQIKQVIQIIRERSSTQGRTKISITAQTKETLENADVIIYSNVSLESNIAPVLIVPGIREAIAKAKSAVKINLGVMEKKRSKSSNEILQRLNQIYRYLTSDDGGFRFDLDLDKEVSNYVDYVLGSYSREEDAEKVFSDFESVVEQTGGTVSGVAVKAQSDEAEMFSTELKEAIIALLGIKKAGFKIVNVKKGEDGGKLVLEKFELSADRRDWIKGQLGLFREDSSVEKIISGIREHRAEIRAQGGVVFDVDKTILPKEAKYVTNYARLVYVFMRLLREGVKVAIISGNSKEEQMSRIVDAIKVQMKNDQSAMENLTFYVSGGATKIGFTREGKENISDDNKEYNIAHAMEKEDIEKAIAGAIRELSANNFGLEGESLNIFVKSAQEKYRHFTMRAPWREANQGFDIPYHAPQEILDFEKQAPKDSIYQEITFPWVEKRGEIILDDGQVKQVKYGSLAIKPVPRFKLNDREIDPRKKIIEAINSRLGDKRGNFNIRPGGSTTIDITGNNAQKNEALRDFIETNSRALMVDSEENKRNFFYFGDEFFENGNDDPIKEYLGKGNILAVNDELRPVTPQAIHIGRSPQATLEFLEEILIKPAEINNANAKKASSSPVSGDLNLIRAQLDILKRDASTGLDNAKVERIIQDVQTGKIRLKGEEVDIIKIVDGQEVVIGKIDMGIAHSGNRLHHRTSNAFIVTPEGKLLLQRRVHNKAYALNLSIFGGHVPAGQNYEATIKKEIKEELGLPDDVELRGNLVRVGEEGQFTSPDWDKLNQESRSLYFYYAIPEELAVVRQNEADLTAKKQIMTQEKFKGWLEEQQKDRTGKGEVWKYYEYLLQEILAIGQQGSIVLFDTFQDGGLETRAELTADLLAPLLDDQVVINNLRSFIQASSPVTEQGTGVRDQGSETAKYEVQTTKDDKLGGIDMNAIDLDKQGGGVDIQFDPAELQEIIDAGIDGFAPVIINITPLPSVLPLLGLEPQRKEDELEVSILN